MNIDFKMLGEIIKDRRKELGKTQTDLAHMMGVTQAYISAVELGKYDNLTIASIMKFADPLQINEKELIYAIVPDQERAEMINEDNSLYEIDEETTEIMRIISELNSTNKKLLKGISLVLKNNN
jgi:transcriptional regulator with XRE-family HTH domain